MNYNETQRKTERTEFNKKEPKERKQLYKEYCDQPTRYFVADFECTTKPPYSVYLATMKEIGMGTTLVFYNIEAFIGYLSTMRDAVVWFHNGEHYDFEFILPVAYRDKIKVSYKPNLTLAFKQGMNEVDKRNGKLKANDKDEPIPVSSKVTFLDSAKIVHGSIKSIGEMLGFEKGMGEVDTPLVAYINSDKDWAYRLHDEDDLITMGTSFSQALVDMRWTEYAIRDTEILEALAIDYDFISHYANNHSTIASIAFDALLAGCPEYADERDNFARYVRGLSKVVRKEYKDMLRRFNTKAKSAYKGGIAYTNPVYANQLRRTKHGYHLDYTSMYPSIYGNPEQYPLPYFMPARRETDLYIVHFDYIECEVKDNCFPLLKNRTDTDGENASAYLTKYAGPLSLTSPEYEYLKEFYHNIKAKGMIKVYYEEHVLLEKALKAHKDKWFPEKAKAKGTRRQYAKDMVNCCYGYLGFYESERNKYELIYDKEKHMIDKVVDGDPNIVGLSYPEVPAAAFITAYGRVKLARDINAIGLEHIVCCDTDSLFVIDVPWEVLTSKVTIDDEIGNFKLEHTFTQIRSIKPKTYAIADDDGKVKAQATAGSNYKFKKISSFVEGTKFASRETNRGPGGVGIVPVLKSL